MTGKGLKQYAAGSHDLVSLSVPGRVFFVKNRKLKEVGAVQPVFDKLINKKTRYCN